MVRVRLLALLGSLAILVPALLAGTLAGGSRDPARSWARSPAEPPYPRPVVHARWSRGSQESLALLRRVTVREAHHAQLALAGCEGRARARSGKHRVGSYRRCAANALGRTQAYASANSRMLSSLVSEAVPTPTCRGRVLALSGSADLLAQIARSTLRSGFDGPWAEVLATSRSIRALARDALQQATRAGWRADCRARPPAPAPPAGPIS
jgi:hypothetical protein